jgi:hypothetical protein
MVRKPFNARRNSSPRLDSLIARLISQLTIGSAWRYYVINQFNRLNVRGNSWLY